VSNVWLAFGLTLFAGMATGIGSAIAFFAKQTNYRFLSISTGFSAGVMLYVSFVEILVKGNDALVEAYGDAWGHWANLGSFFGGILLIGLIDNLIPSAENPHELHAQKESAPLRPPTLAKVKTTEMPGIDAHVHDHHAQHKLLRMGLFTALAIGIHNFPEGLATFLAALENPALGTVIAIAIALHNIPEGVSVAVPIYYATGDRRKAFWYSLLSGMAEPVGAGLAYLAFWVFVGTENGMVPPEVMGMLFGGVAGIMVYISLDELLPTSRAYGRGHDTIAGLIAGMAMMAVSLVLMRVS